MSLLKSIGKIFTGAVKTLAPLAPIIGGMLGGPPGALLGTAIGGVAGGQARTLPSMPSVMPGGAPLGLPQLPGMAGLTGQLGLPGFAGAAKTKRGRLTGAAIPRGFQERMSKSGMVYLAKMGRRRGLTSRDISTFRRVDRLLHRYAGRAHAPPRRRKA